MRKGLRPFAYVASLLMLGASTWTPGYAQPVPQPGGGGSSGASTSADNTWTGAQTFLDNKFLVCDDGDNTKCWAIQASGFTTGNTRTFTFPNASSTVAGIDVQNSWTSTQIYNSAGVGISLGTVVANASNGINFQTANTPDIGWITTGTTANAWNVGETADAGTDANNGSCGTATCTHPQINIHDNDASTVTQYTSNAYWGQAGRAIKALTESSATSAFQVSIASGAGTGGTVNFTVFAADATDQQTLTGVLQFSGINKAGTETCATPTLTGTALNSVSTGTLTCTYAADTSPANACLIQFNCTSSLTQTTLDVYYRVNLTGPGQVTPQ